MAVGGGLGEKDSLISELVSRDVPRFAGTGRHAKPRKENTALLISDRAGRYDKHHIDTVTCRATSPADAECRRCNRDESCSAS